MVGRIALNNEVSLYQINRHGHLETIRGVFIHQETRPQPGTNQVDEIHAWDEPHFIVDVHRGSAYHHYKTRHHPPIQMISLWSPCLCAAVLKLRLCCRSCVQAFFNTAAQGHGASRRESYFLRTNSYTIAAAFAEACPPRDNNSFSAA